MWGSIWAHLTGGPSPLSALRDGIVWELRLPRILTAAAVGAGLALVGAIMRALTRNQLADPYLLGISPGASLGAVTVLLLGFAVVLPLAAFVGALLALAATLARAGAFGRITPTRTVLAGVAVSSLAAMHDLALAASHADHVVVLSSGRVVASGPTEQTPTEQTLTPGLIYGVYGVRAAWTRNPLAGRPLLAIG